MSCLPTNPLRSDACFSYPLKSTWVVATHALWVARRVGKWQLWQPGMGQSMSVTSWPLRGQDGMSEVRSDPRLTWVTHVSIQDKNNNWSCRNHDFGGKPVGGCSSYDTIAPWPELTRSSFVPRVVHVMHLHKLCKISKRLNSRLASISEKNVGVFPHRPGQVLRDRRRSNCWMGCHHSRDSDADVIIKPAFRWSLLWWLG